MPDIQFNFREGGGSEEEILFGRVEIKSTLVHSRGTSLVLTKSTTWDIIDGLALATNVQPTPEPVDGQIEWAYEVTAHDRKGDNWQWLVGVPNVTGAVAFVTLPRYFETKPPLFGQGPKGEPGESATIAVGTVSGGTTAQVTNSGTPNEAVLNFVLPKGDKGDTGAGVPAGGTALEFIRKNSAGTGNEWVSATEALADATSAGFMSASDKTLLGGATELATPNSIVRRSSSGRVLYPDPTLPQNPVTLGYLDNALTPFVLKDTLVHNVMDFGAVGDGVTDDREAVVAAIDASQGTFGQGGTVYFPPGKYTWSSAIVIPSNTVFMGESATLQKKGTGGNAAFFAITSKGQKGYGSGAKNVEFRGLRIEGDFASGRQTALLAAHHGEDILVEKCVFSQCQSYGHVFDLQGCNGVTFRDCVFEGHLNTSTSLYVEAIQLDNSSRSGASYVDTPGSYDGLPTINVTIEQCKFLPLTIGEVVHPAPNPVGSHYGIEGMYFSGLRFMRNVVYAGHAQTAGTHRGMLHIVNLIDSSFEDNLFINTSSVAVSAIALRSQSVGYTVADVELTSPTSSTWATPQVPKNISIRGNTYRGFNNTALTEHVVLVQGASTVFAQDIVVYDEHYQNCCGGAITENVSGNLLQLENVRTARVWGHYSDKCRRAVNIVNCTDVTLEAISARNSSGGGQGAITVWDSTRVTIKSLDVDIWRNYTVYLNNVSGLRIDDFRATGYVSGPGIAVNGNGCSRLFVSGGNVNGGVRGVVFYGASSNGFVKNVISTVTDSSVVISADSPTVVASENLTVA